MTIAAPPGALNSAPAAERTIVAGRPRVAFVVNGSETSAMAERARAFADRLLHAVEPVVVYRRGRKGVAAARMLRRLQRLRPELCYVLDLGLDGLLAAFFYGKATGVRFAVDPGDDVRPRGRPRARGRLAMLATRTMDRIARRSAAAWIVRGARHRERFADEGIAAEWIPDGVDVDRFTPDPCSRPAPPSADRPLVIGMLGSVVWIPTRNSCYGWELVELVALLARRLAIPVRGVVIGDGDGLPSLQRRCRELGVEDRVEFAGRVPLAELPSHLHRWHFALSTQSNDRIGAMRTTGKLPLYLAAGRFVLASDVGEAARVLPREMVCSYRGEHDPAYPETLADRVEVLLKRNVDLTFRPDCVELARAQFDYDLLAARLERVLHRLLERRRP
jgi:glycosyltransferase involved in cell wall biosynthesis